MAWMGKRYEVRLAGFGVLGRDIANLMLLGGYFSLMRPLGYEMPEMPAAATGQSSPFPHLVILISGFETLGEMQETCRQQKDLSPDDFVVAMLIGDLQSANSVQLDEIADLRQLADLFLCFPYPTKDARAQFGWSQDPVIQTLRALVIPAGWDEYVDFDFNDLRTAFADTSGYVAVAESGYTQGAPETRAEFNAFLAENDLAANCRDAAVFVSVRGTRALRFDRDVGVLEKLHATVTNPENLIVSFVKDYALGSDTEIFVTIFAVKRRPADIGHGEVCPSVLVANSPARDCYLELPAFLTQGKEQNEKDNEQQKTPIDGRRALTARLNAHSDDAEKWILGALLIDSNLWDLVVNFAPRTNVDECCFYQARHQHIFRAIKDLIANQNAVNCASVASMLRQCDETAAEEWGEYLEQLEASVMSFSRLADGIRRYGYIVRDRWLVRQKAAEDLETVSGAPILPG